MSNAELIAALRRKAKFFSIWRDAEGQNETEILLLQAAAALQKSEAEVVRLGGVIAEAIRVEDSMLDKSFYSIVGGMVRVLERGTSATVSAEDGAK